MSYASGGLIQATDYNNLAWGGTQGTYTSSPNNIAYVMGVGNGETGYGQDISAINTVAATGTVTAVQWSGMLTTLNRALGHQSGAGAQISVTPAITTGSVITHFASVATAVNTINTNKAAFTAQGSTLTGTVDSTNPYNNSVAAYSAIRDTNVTFASANAARYFFNAGGQINFFCSATNNGINNSRNNTIVDMINQVGGLSAFRNNSNGGRVGSGGSIVTNNTSFGYRQAVFNSATTIVNNDVAGTYSGHDVQLQVFSQSADYSNGSNGNSIVFRLYYSVPEDDAFGGGFNIILSTRADIVFPSTTYLTNSWGTPTITFDSA